jgi:hypothetical protein
VTDAARRLWENSAELSVALRSDDAVASLVAAMISGLPRKPSKAAPRKLLVAPCVLPQEGSLASRRRPERGPAEWTPLVEEIMQSRRAIKANASETQERRRELQEEKKLCEERLASEIAQRGDQAPPLVVEMHAPDGEAEMCYVKLKTSRAPERHTVKTVAAVLQEAVHRLLAELPADALLDANRAEDLCEQVRRIFAERRQLKPRMPRVSLDRVRRARSGDV